MVLVLATVITAGAGAEAASLSMSWNAPSTNADGTPLRDLAGYRVYLSTVLPACPSPSFHSVSSPTTRPAAGQTVSTSITALSAGTTHFVRLTAVDTTGNESACSSAASGVAQPDFSVTPSATSSFGTVAIGGTADRTFTVQNTSAASISVTASTGAPFSIVSGASLSLAAGVSRTVTVRFQPTSAGAFAGNVTFTAAGDRVSRGVSGSTAAAASTTPTSTVATSARLSVTTKGPGAGTVTSAPAGIACVPTCSRVMVKGAPVTLTARAASGSIFAGWSGACRGSAACVVTMNAATTVTATFAKAPLVPVARTLSPVRATAGSAGLTLTVKGRGFVASSVVRWRGLSRPTTFVSASRLRVAITASDLAAPGSVPVSVVTPSPGGGTSAPLAFTIATRPPPPPTPGSVRVTRRTAATAAATFTFAWSAVSQAKSYRYVAVFDDHSATVEGAVAARSFRLRMPYHVSGAAADARVCIRSVDATGQQSVGQSCSEVPVPARPPAPAARPATPPPPPEPVFDLGWGVG